MSVLGSAPSSTPSTSSSACPSTETREKVRASTLLEMKVFSLLVLLGNCFITSKEHSAWQSGALIRGSLSSKSMGMQGACLLPRSALACGPPAPPPSARDSEWEAPLSWLKLHLGPEGDNFSLSRCLAFSFQAQLPISLLKRMCKIICGKKTTM